ncbi:MAG: hypothetical protein K5681_05540 [Treponema sp.]|nr:hypothetical protein [Treponema sp.]
MEDILDPEIAALLGNAENESTGDMEDLPIEDFNPDELPTNRKSLFSKSVDEVVTSVKSRSIHEVDLSQKGFEKIENPLSDTPNPVFNDQKYYKIALTGENQSAQRVHQLLTKYLTCQDPKDRAVFRQQIVTAYWELLRGMVGKMVDSSVPMPKRMMVRFGVILPSLFKQESKEYFSKIKLDNKTGEPVMYVDEWFREIASGRMNNSATDEKKQVKAANMTPDQAASAEQSRLMQLQSKNSGRMQSSENTLSLKENERAMLENELQNNIKELCQHQPIMGFEPHTTAYSDLQRKQFAVITDVLHKLSRNDKELAKALEEFKEAKTTYDNVQNKISAGGGATISTNDIEAVKIEYETVRQMAKMTIGRRGNQFPIFTREFYHCTERGTGTRENVLEVLRWVESIDPGVFHRIHKNIPNRIVPYVLLVPTYGDRGFCWEPFDRYNRVTSRGRIVVPMYPKDLTIAVLTAVADLRWQVAKEKASYYWMEEGLTGQYYQHVEQLKLKGDLKEFFIEDYILWMTKESTGVQRLDKDVRGIFWRNMPFPKELKEDLRKRSLVYDELCKKDANREMSDGY